MRKRIKCERQLVSGLSTVFWRLPASFTGILADFESTIAGRKRFACPLAGSICTVKLEQRSETTGNTSGSVSKSVLPELCPLHLPRPSTSVCSCAEVLVLDGLG